MFVRVFVGFVVSCCALAAPARAADSLSELMSLEKSLKYQSGDVAVGSNLATLHLGTNYRFLNATDARKVIVDGWGNPPAAADDVLGMIAPGKMSPLADHSWGVVVRYVDEGHIDDADAAKIDYGDLLSQMQAGIKAANAERKRAGYETMNLVGWARTPSYDHGAKKLIWAKEIAFAGSDEHTLNYDVRVLGRSGVLSMNAVGEMGDLKKFEVAMADIAGHTEFNAGQRYADFDASRGDKVAAYGVAGLIAGGVAAKAGFFKVLLGLLIAAKKLVIVALIAIFAVLKSVFSSLGNRAKPVPAVASRPMPSAGVGGNPPRE